ncbi:hypothetical protein MOQ_004114 [Trypanosoma cruzi marinkellei]|uniref:Uncharacterized protein n=1 Tax=Trypanosoma cruzi marinkellei TaxID=85056 RepID=K2N256_TRYCR|nr:hypothetical protein MOQ_004114 [Trypanosoma cruzi marinkellei]
MAQHETRCKSNDDNLMSQTNFIDHLPFGAVQTLERGRAAAPSLGVPRKLPHELWEQQLAAHLLRLKELQLERISLVERSSQCLLRERWMRIATQKHREATSRITALQRRLQQLLTEGIPACTEDAALQTKPLSSFHYLPQVDVTALFSLTVSCSADVEALTSRIQRVMGVIAEGEASNSVASLSSSLMQTLPRWIQDNYVSVFFLRYMQMTFTLAALQLQRSVDEKMKSCTLKEKQEIQNRREERQRAREARHMQLIRAKERLERTEKHAFEIRKRIFLLHEWITGKRRLPTGQLLNPIMCTEVLHRIRADLAMGEMEFLLQLTADNGRALIHTTA